MSDAHKHAKQITIHLPIENIQPSLIDELTELCEKHVGETPLHLRVYDDIKQNVITLIAPPIHMDKDFYHWMKVQESEDIFTHTVQ
jgi:hypothetical protein